MTHAKGVVPTIAAVAIILILVSTFASAGPVQLKNDNGDFYQGSFVGRIKGDIDGAVFSPDPALFPITIQSVEFGFHRPRGADHISDSAQVRVQIYAVASGVPGDILAESAAPNAGRLRCVALDSPGPAVDYRPARHLHGGREMGSRDGYGSRSFCRNRF